MLWRGGSVLEDSNTGSGVISRTRTTAATGLPGSGQGSELGQRAIQAAQGGSSYVSSPRLLSPDENKKEPRIKNKQTNETE